MSFAAPLWLAAAAAVAVGLVIAHLFSTSVPQRDFLPTVRFVPEGTPLAVLRTRRISDVVLLLVRLLAVALIGLALSGVHVRRGGPPRVVVVDRSRAVASIAEVRDSALTAASGGSVVVAFDSIARRVTRDSVETLTVSPARGSLSAGLVAAHRALAAVTDDRAATELVIVSPLVREAVDSATARLVALWEGPVRVIRVAESAAPTPLRVDVRATGDDPIAAVVSSLSSVLGKVRDVQAENSQRRTENRLIRTVPTHADSLWARDSGGVLVLWPADASGVLTRRERADSQGGIAAGPHVVIAEFAREFQPRAGTVLVRWLDGEPAATEIAMGRGCIREVAIPVDPVGDVALRESFRGIVGSLVEPCGGARDFRAAVSPSAARDLADLQIPRRFAPRDDALPLWLAIAALATLIAEQLLRARRRAVA